MCGIAGFSSLEETLDLERVSNLLHHRGPDDFGIFEDKDVKTDRVAYKYDLVISLGSPSLESLGRVFSEHRHFFHNLPI